MESGASQEEIEEARQRIIRENLGLGSGLRKKGERVLLHVLTNAPDGRPRVIEVLPGGRLLMEQSVSYTSF